MIKRIFKGFLSTKQGTQYLLVFLITIIASMASTFVPDETLYLISIILTIAFVFTTINLGRLLGVSFVTIIFLSVIPFLPFGGWVNFFYFAHFVSLSGQAPKKEKPIERS